MQPMLAISAHHHLTVFLSLWLQLYFYFGEFSQLSLLHTFVFVSVALTFPVVIFACVHFNNYIFHVTFTLSCVNFNFLSICKCRFHIFLLTQVSLLVVFSHVCVTPLHITRGYYSTLSFIILSYIS